MRFDPVATPGRAYVEPAQEEHESTPITPLGADLGSNPVTTPGGTVTERLARPRPGLSPGGETARQTRSTTRRAESGGQGLEEVVRPNTGRGMTRPPGFAPGPEPDETPGGLPSRTERRWAPSLKDQAQQAASSRSTQHLARRVTKRLNCIFFTGYTHLICRHFTKRQCCLGTQCNGGNQTSCDQHMLRRTIRAVLPAESPRPART